MPRPEEEQVAVPVATPVAETVRNKLHRVEAHFDDLQSCYFACRRNGNVLRERKIEAPQPFWSDSSARHAMGAADWMC